MSFSETIGLWKFIENNTYRSKNLCNFYKIKDNVKTKLNLTKRKEHFPRNCLKSPIDIIINRVVF